MRSVGQRVQECMKVGCLADATRELLASRAPAKGRRCSAFASNKCTVPVHGCTSQKRGSILVAAMEPLSLLRCLRTRADLPVQLYLTMISCDLWLFCLLLDIAVNLQHSGPAYLLRVCECWSHDKHLCWASV